MGHQPTNRERHQGQGLSASALPDTIAAIATAKGQGGIGVVRLSGGSAHDIARRLTAKKLPPASQHALRRFHDADEQLLDEGLLLRFDAPNSFTGEDVIELQAHGGPVVLDLLLRAAIEKGARMARPGEFSERAFLNGRLDLAQAEAIADLIESQSAEAARSATRSLSGAFSACVNTLVEQLINLRAYIEAALDFPEEEIDFLADRKVTEKLIDLERQCQATLNSARQGQLLREGMRVVIAGAPNAGKSTLINRLAGEEVAIVTDIPGTTRDRLRAEINLKGVPVQLIDTAGLRESNDPIEKIGIQRSHEAIADADLVILLQDANTSSADSSERPEADCLVVNNKIDLNNNLEAGRRAGQLWLSAKTGAGVDALVDAILEHAGYKSETDGVFSARRRHINALQNALRHIQQGRARLSEQRAGELCAEELRLAQDELSSITGRFSSDDLLGEIFSRFCIGK